MIVEQMKVLNLQFSHLINVLCFPRRITKSLNANVPISCSFVKLQSFILDCGLPFVDSQTFLEKSKHSNSLEVGRLSLKLNKTRGVTVNKGRFCNNIEIDTLISKRLYVENKAKLSQLTRADFATIAKSTHYFRSDYLQRTKRNSLNWKLKTPSLQYRLFIISS